MTEQEQKFRERLRDPSRWPLLRYVHHTTTPSPAARVLTPNGPRLVETHPYRFAAMHVPDDIFWVHMEIHSQRAMAHRVSRSLSELLSPESWPEGHCLDSPTGFKGVSGPLDLSTSHRKDIKRTFDAMFEAVSEATIGAVDRLDVRFVVSPTWAERISLCPEMVDHIKNSPAARDELEERKTINSRYGLPSVVYGYAVIVEPVVGTRKVASGDIQVGSIVGNGDLLMVTVDDAVEGVPSFSTAFLHVHRDMEIERLENGDAALVDQFGVDVACPTSGFLCQNTLEVAGC